MRVTAPLLFVPVVSDSCCGAACGSWSTNLGEPLCRLPRHRRERRGARSEYRQRGFPHGPTRIYHRHSSGLADRRHAGVSESVRDRGDAI